LSAAPPDPVAAIREGVLLLRGREGRGEGKERGGEKKEGWVRGKDCLLFI